MTQQDLTEGPTPIGRRLMGLVNYLLAVPAYPALFLLLVVAAFVQPRLLSIPFLLIVLRQAVPLALSAIGQSLPMIGRSIDLSIAGVIGLSNVVLALSLVANGPAWISIAAPLAIGAAVGVVNALLIANVRASAVVVTLGSSIVLIGISYIVSGGAPGGEVNAVVRFLAIGRIDRFPIAGVILIVLAALVALLLKRSVLGHSLYAVGSSYSAAWLGGIRVTRALFLSHVFSGMFAGAAAIILTGYIGTGTLNLGAELVMASVAAVVLGGTSFGGGPGGVLGVVAGALALTFLNNLLTGMGVAKPVQLIIQGGIIASAAALAIRRDN